LRNDVKYYIILKTRLPAVKKLWKSVKIRRSCRYE